MRAPLITRLAGTPFSKRTRGRRDERPSTPPALIFRRRNRHWRRKPRLLRAFYDGESQFSATFVATFKSETGSRSAGSIVSRTDASYTLPRSLIGYVTIKIPELGRESREAELELAMRKYNKYHRS